MKKNLQIVIIIILLYIICSNPQREGFFGSRLSHDDVRSESNQKKYQVIEQYGDKQIAAEKLAYLNEYIIEFLRHMRKKYIWERQGTHQQQRIIERTLNNYNPDNLFENIPEGIHDTSYVEDKGIKFAMCLRKKITGNNEIHDDNILQFVLLHELAHIGAIEYGHEDEFWSVFKFFLTEATKIGIHTPIDYSISPEFYCGLEVTYNPFFDDI